MQLSKRENDLLEVFIRNGLSLTAQQLADFANVSTKTVYRTVKKINESSESGDIILSEVGKGLVLDYDRFLKENAKSGGGDRITEPKERRNNVTLSLLFKAPHKVLIKDLFDPFHVSDAAVSGDIQRISEYLKNYHLTLERKDGRIFVKGTEREIRKAVLSIIAANNLTDEVFATNESFINSYDIDFITSILEFIDKELHTTIVYPYNVNIFSHLYVLVQRIREGKLLNDHTGESLDKEEQELIDMNKNLYDLAKIVINKISHYLHQKLPKDEEFHLFQYLISSRIDSSKVANKVENRKAREVTRAFADEMSQELGISVNSQANINDLLGHIEPLLYRAENGILIKNGILKDIQLEYSEMFAIVKTVANRIAEKFQFPIISDDEIGFLTLYFVKYKELQHSQKRILIMCSSGVGTSELLKVKVKRAFPDIAIVDVLSSKKYLKHIEDYKDIDLILTTIHLTKQPEIPSILVNSVFTKQDEKNVKQILGGI